VLGLNGKNRKYNFKTDSLNFTKKTTPTSPPVQLNKKVCQKVKSYCAAKGMAKKNLTQASKNTVMA
jgi:hypothetical protein